MKSPPLLKSIPHTKVRCSLRGKPRAGSINQATTGEPLGDFEAMKVEVPGLGPALFQSVSQTYVISRFGAALLIPLRVYGYWPRLADVSEIMTLVVPDSEGDDAGSYRVEGFESWRNVFLALVVEGASSGG